MQTFTKQEHIYIDTHAFVLIAGVAAEITLTVPKNVRPVAVKGLMSVTMSDGLITNASDALDKHITLLAGVYS